MWDSIVASMAFVKAIGSVAMLICFFVLLLRGRISLRAMRERRWRWWP